MMLSSMPKMLIYDVIIEWQRLKDLVNFDTTACNHNIRSILFSLYRSKSAETKLPNTCKLNLHGQYWLSLRGVPISYLEFGNVEIKNFLISHRLEIKPSTLMGKFAAYVGINGAPKYDYSQLRCLLSHNVTKIIFCQNNFRRFESTKHHPTPIIEIANKCRNLRTVNLKHCNNLTDDSLIHLAFKCQNITDIDISEKYSQITDRGVIYLVKTVIAFHP